MAENFPNLKKIHEHTCLRSSMNSMKDELRHITVKLSKHEDEERILNLQRQGTYPSKGIHDKINNLFLFKKSWRPEAVG